MQNEHSHHSIYLSRFLVLLPCCIFLFSQCTTINGNDNSTTESQSTYLLNANDSAPKQKGAHIFGHLDSTNLQPFIQNNIDWITLVPYASQKDYDSPSVIYFRKDSLANIRRDSMYKSQIALAHSYGFKVFLKPHIWLHENTDGKWRSDIYPSTEDNWQQWKKDYREYILLYAKVAEKNKVDLFCIGTELTRLSIEKPDYWLALIKEIRTIYSGKITYAANWYKEYENITFWNELDYIGIQAYFPLTKNNYPNVEQISKGWNKYLPKIASISKKYNRKVLFTEMGYKSTSDSAIEPWAWIEYEGNQDRSLSYETQANCYQAFFNSVWEKDWFAGVHIWQMRSEYKKGRGYTDVDFTPQGKPAALIIAKGFE